MSSMDLLGAFYEQDIHWPESQYKSPFRPSKEDWIKKYQELEVKAKHLLDWEMALQAVQSDLVNREKELAIREHRLKLKERTQT